MLHVAMWRGFGRIGLWHVGLIDSMCNDVVKHVMHFGRRRESKRTGKKMVVRMITIALDEENSIGLLS